MIFIGSPSRPFSNIAQIDLLNWLNRRLHVPGGPGTFLTAKHLHFGGTLPF
jgi:hypothetical protein